MLNNSDYIVDFEIEGKTINILTIFTEANDKKDSFNPKFSLSWLDFIVKISMVLNTILFLILLIVFIQIAEEIILKKNYSLFLKF